MKTSLFGFPPFVGVDTIFGRVPVQQNPSLSPVLYLTFPIMSKRSCPLDRLAPQSNHFA
jgi:hypothetical protein